MYAAWQQDKRSVQPGSRRQDLYNLEAGYQTCAVQQQDSKSVQFGSRLQFLCRLAAGYMYRQESNLAISSSPVTKIMYRFYWRTAVNEKKINF